MLSYNSKRSWEPPLFSIGRLPIHITELVILVQVVGMFAVVATGQDILEYISFHPEKLKHGHVWTPITYAFFERHEFMYAIGLFFFYSFGRQVESLIGKIPYAMLLVMLLLTAPFVQSALAFAGLQTSLLQGGYFLHLSVFLAFCGIYPNAPSFFNIPIKWFGLVFFLLAISNYIMIKDWPLLAALLANSTLAISIVRKSGFNEKFSFWRELFGEGAHGGGEKFRRTRKVHKAKKIKTEPKLRPHSEYTSERPGEVDRILDKINEHGLHSLTEEERRRLKAAAQK